MLLFERSKSLDLFLDLGCLTDSVAQVEEFRSANFTSADHFDRLDVGRMEREGLFGPYAVGYAADGESFAYAAVSFGDDRAFEHLRSDAGTFYDTAIISS